jgi:hypothetical protein
LTCAIIKNTYNYIRGHGGTAKTIIVSKQQKRYPVVFRVGCSPRAKIIVDHFTAGDMFGRRGKKTTSH